MEAVSDLILGESKVSPSLVFMIVVFIIVRHFLNTEGIAVFAVSQEGSLVRFTIA